MTLSMRPTGRYHHHHHHHQSLDREGRWGTTDDFAGTVTQSLTVLCNDSLLLLDFAKLTFTASKRRDWHN